MRNVPSVSSAADKSLNLNSWLQSPVCVCVRKLTQLKLIPQGAQPHNSRAERGTLIEWELFLVDHKLKIIDLKEK